MEEVAYWSEHRVERVEYVADLLRRLEAMNWPNKSDIGWSEFDVELFGNHWNSVQLVTATEDHNENRFLLRVRLRPRWTLEAKVAFWALSALEVLMLGLLHEWSSWRWLILFSVLPVVWFIRQQARHLQSMIVIFLDEVAKERGLLKIGAPQPGVEPGPTTRPAGSTTHEAPPRAQEQPSA